VSKDKNFCYN